MPERASNGRGADEEANIGSFAANRRTLRKPQLLKHLNERRSTSSREKRRQAPKLEFTACWRNGPVMAEQAGQYWLNYAAIRLAREEHSCSRRLQALE